MICICRSDSDNEGADSGRPPRPGWVILRESPDNETKENKYARDDFREHLSSAGAVVDLKLSQDHTRKDVDTNKIYVVKC